MGGTGHVLGNVRNMTMGMDPFVYVPATPSSKHVITEVALIWEWLLQCRGYTPMTGQSPQTGERLSTPAALKLAGALVALKLCPFLKLCPTFHTGIHT